MTRRSGIVLIALALTAAALGLYGQQPSSEERLAKFDSGPDSIDVSGYPADMQEGYTLFASRCSKCHSLARPINSDYALPEEWSRYVKRMMRKPGSGISPKDGKKIYEFLAYDSSVRKTELLEKKKAEASGE